MDSPINDIGVDADIISNGKNRQKKETDVLFQDKLFILLINIFKYIFIFIYKILAQVEEFYFLKEIDGRKNVIEIKHSAGVLRLSEKERISF